MNKNSTLVMVILGLLVCTGCRSINPRNEPLGEVRPGVYNILMEAQQTKLPVRTVDKFNPVWWFGNADDPEPPADYIPDSKFRKTKWAFRNPFHNFTFYVIGITDKEIIQTSNSQRNVFQPGGGWLWSVGKYKRLRLPFISHQGKHIQWYIGWRGGRTFGLKFQGSDLKDAK